MYFFVSSALLDYEGQDQGGVAKSTTRVGRGVTSDDQTTLRLRLRSQTKNQPTNDTMNHDAISLYV